MTFARTPFQIKPDPDIVLVDSRQLCAEATGRKGGHIKTMTFAMWADRKKIFGLEEAIQISLFENNHLEAMESAMKEDDIDADLVLTEGVEAYYDRPTFDRAVKALEEMRLHIPGLAAKHKVYTSLALLQSEMKLSSRCVGAIGVPSFFFGYRGKNSQPREVSGDRRLSNSCTKAKTLRKSRKPNQFKYIIESNLLGYIFSLLRSTI